MLRYSLLTYNFYKPDLLERFFTTENIEFKIFDEKDKRTVKKKGRIINSRQGNQLQSLVKIKLSKKRITRTLNKKKYLRTGSKFSYLGN